MLEGTDMLVLNARNINACHAMKTKYQEMYAFTISSHISKRLDYKLDVHPQATQKTGFNEWEDRNRQQTKYKQQHKTRNKTKKQEEKKIDLNFNWIK